MQHILDYVAARVSERPDEAAIIHLPAAGGSSQTWSWQRLWQQAERIATLLLELQVRRGEPVAWQVANRPEFVAITLAVLRVGAICCPLMPMFRERELTQGLERSRARVLFITDEFRARRPIAELASLAPALRYLEHVLVLDTAQAPHPLPADGRLTWSRLAERSAAVSLDVAALERRSVGPTAAAQLLFTSGTSGTPKGVVQRQSALTEAVHLEIAHLGLTERDRIFVPSPLAHQTGFLYGMWLALALGVAQVLQESWEPQQALAGLRETGASFVQAATPFLADLVQAVEQGAAAPERLRIFVATGATVPRLLAQRATGILHTAVCGAFGTTEGCLATLAAPDDPPEKAWGSDGRVLSSIRLRICDEDGRVLPAATEGHFEIRSPTMFEGYLDDPKATAAAYTDGEWYRTGDLAVIDEQGYLHVTGRVKDVINRGGEKIPVAEIEQLLYQHPSVREAAIVAMPDPRLGERACVFVVLHAGRGLDFRALCAYLDERRVAKPYWPERLELVEELPRTPSGKIQKYLLRERARAFAPGAAAVSAGPAAQSATAGGSSD